ncbi:MAG: hypothetical protein ACRD4U_03130 [Candidatus Acidiferrales bacterium]
MLAYVFWHWPQPQVDVSDYEARLRDFQKTLRDHPPPGFRGSVVFRVSGAPWIQAQRGYEDWYLVEGSVALDPLNDAAIAPACRAAHDAAARLAAGGTAGLYRLRAGQAALAEVKFSSWFGKPAGMLYDDFYTLLAPVTARPGVALWGRQMTLGPTPEFCLHSAAPFELPANLRVQRVTLQRLQD